MLRSKSSPFDHLSLQCRSILKFCHLFVVLSLSITISCGCNVNKLLKQSLKQSMPHASRCFSKSKKFFFEITPIKAKNEDDRERCHGTLTKRIENGEYVLVWATQLPGYVPFDAWVSDDGRSVATFRDGSEISIYGDKGQLIRNYELEDLLSKDEIEKSGGDSWKVNENMGLIVLTVGDKIFDIDFRTGKIL